MSQPRLIHAGAHARQLAELAAAEEPIERLHVGSKPMVVRDEHLAVHAIRRGENPLDAARRERQRPLAEHVHLRLERREHVRLVQMVRRRDDDRVELVELEQVLDVREHVGDVEAISERARLRAIVVA